MTASRSAARSGWSEREAKRWSRGLRPRELGLLVYGSRLLGADRSLVLAGGGNTSAKAMLRDLHGDPVEAIWIKASGADLETATAESFTALELAPTRRLLELDRLDDRDLGRALLRARLDPEAPPPSIETLLHALLPFGFVDHAHPDALLALIQSRSGRRRAEELYGDDCLIVPWTKPGFTLARRCRRLWERSRAEGRRPRGMVLLHHGLIAFADDRRESFETLVELARRAERRLPRAPRRPVAADRPPRWTPVDLAGLRAEVSRRAGRPLVMTLHRSPAVLGFLDRSDLARIAGRGPLTPDHVLRTRRVPLLVRDPARIGRAIEAWAGAREREDGRFRAGRGMRRLDFAPRVALVPGTGILGFGRTAAEAETAAEIYRHTCAAIERAEALDGWRPLGARELFEIELWELEQAKLDRAAAPAPLAGRVALVTGSASGIGRASARSLVARGAAVVGLDLAPSALAGDYVGLVGDAADPKRLRAAVAETVQRFGGVDMLVSNLGVFPASARIEELSEETWNRTLELNAGAHRALLAETIPLLRRAPAGGAVVVVGSKNVPAPGPGAAAYSASKAALTQLARVAALELAADGVRVNVVHPDAVFDTGLWTDEVLAARAARYGLTVEEYRRRNLLRREVRSEDVGELVAELAGDLFGSTTGAQIPVDGGNERVI